MGETQGFTMSGGGGHDDGGLGHRIASGQAGGQSHGAGGAKHDLTNFDRDGEGALKIMHGNGVTLSQPLDEIIRSLKEHATTSSSSSSGGDTAFHSQSSTAQPMLNSTANQQSFVELTGGNKPTSQATGKEDSGRGGRSA